MVESTLNVSQEPLFHREKGLVKVANCWNILETCSLQGNRNLLQIINITWNGAKNRYVQFLYRYALEEEVKNYSLYT